MRRINVVRIEMIKEKTMPYEFKRIAHPKDAMEIIKNFIGNADREYFVVAMLDTKNNINGLNVVTIGTLNSSLIHPREVFKAAVLSNASRIYLAHNHPSGDPTPSYEDIELTRRLKDAGDILGIQVLDHIVIGDDNKYVSFIEQGYL